MERERDVGIICVIIYDDLALEVWTQRRERERERVERRKQRALLQTEDHRVVFTM